MPARILLVPLVIAAALSSSVEAQIEPSRDGIAPSLQIGCAGVAGDWAATLPGTRDGGLGFSSRGGPHDTCLLTVDATLQNVTLSARVDASRGRAGFVLRYGSRDRYIGVLLDTRAGVVEASRREGGGPATRLAVAMTRTGAGVRLLRVALEGPRLVVSLDGDQILAVDGVPARAGAAGLIAETGTAARFDDAVISRPDEDSGGEEALALLPPVSPPSGQVGRPYSLEIPGQLQLVAGALPPGIGIGRPGGKLEGTPSTPG
ncbi:MAG TPA: hypothetical protein VFG76_01935, partial [Candidatus Polarisedimenticolia bacterium]|nr:hypothetical protein [Candidatus Polarisedimenticolia bacterium]